MPVSLRCPRCGKSASAPDSYVGHPVLCRQCRQQFTAVPVSANATVPPAEASPAPQSIGRFQVRAELGSGAFGTVYRAYDPQLDREVALKVPRAGTLNTPKRVSRFLREGRTAARLFHPHIVPVYDAGQDGSHFYIASAFIEGRTLADAVGEGAFDFRRAAEVAHDLAVALAYAHGEGVVHRDVKPANVMLDGAGRPHLMDFGLARRQEGDEKLTQDGAVMGTPAYMAPEQAAAEGTEAGPACDQYSLGVLLYELLTDAVPFAGPVDMVLYHAAHSEPRPPRALRPDVPPDLQTICLKAMAKRPADRYADCRAMADDLRRWQEGEPIKSRRPGLVERAARWCRREPALTAAVAAAALCLLAVAGTATAMARHDAAARRNSEQLQQQAEGLAARLQTANDDLRRESEQRVEAEVARRRVEWEKGQTVEAFEKYVAAMLAGHRALDEGRYDDAIRHFDEAAEQLGGTNAVQVSQGMRQKALALKAAPPPSVPENGEKDKVVAAFRRSQELLKAGKYAEADDAALSALELGPKDPRPIRDLQRRIQQEWQQADDRQRERNAFGMLMDDGKKYLDKKEYDDALKALGAAIRRAPDADSAAWANDKWNEARAGGDREASKKLRDDGDKEKAKTDLLMKIAESQSRAQCYLDVNLPGEAEATYKQLGAYLTKQRTDAAVGDVAVKLLVSNDRLLNEARVLRQKAERDYEKAMAAGTVLLKEGIALRDPGSLAAAVWKFADATGYSPSLSANKEARARRSDALTALNDVLQSMPKPKGK
jgi:tRNA A-37 threonylcarbamoyl transferase component Bud32/tetratricopeptide (TPR) repeat protein